MTNTNTEQPEALPTPEAVMDQAQVFASTWALYGSGSILEPEDSAELAAEEKEKLAVMVLRLHVRIEELEAQLSAGGVEPLRKKAAAPQAVQAAEGVPSHYRNALPPYRVVSAEEHRAETEHAKHYGLEHLVPRRTPLYTHPTQQGLDAQTETLRAELAEETEAAENWRRLALQFDHHRLQALGHLKAIPHPDSSVDEYKTAELFLKAPPLDGESVLAQRIAKLSAAATQAQEDAPVGFAWSGWACMYPGKLPRLYGALEIASVNLDAANGDQLIHLSTSPGPKAQAAASTAGHGLEQFIEQVGDVHFQRCRVGSKEGAIRWDIEFGHYGDEVRGKTLREAITKAIAAQAKKGEAQQ